jgi:hypothetical protein
MVQEAQESIDHLLRVTPLQVVNGLENSQPSDGDVFVGPHVSSGAESLTISKDLWFAVFPEREIYVNEGGTKLDESAVLFSRGKLCRANPMSARDTK